jgi:hypothetical protein
MREKMRLAPVTNDEFQQIQAILQAVITPPVQEQQQLATQIDDGAMDRTLMKISEE